MEKRIAWRSASLIGIAFALLAPAVFGQSIEQRWGKTNTLLEEKKYQEALEILNGILADTALIARARPTVLFRIAYVYTGLEQQDKAISTWKEVLTLQPTNGIAWANLGWSQYLIGKMDDALASTKKAVELDSTLSFAAANLGLYHLDLGKQAEALKWYEHAIRQFKATDTNDGMLEDLAMLEKKKPELKSVIAGVRTRLEAAAKSKQAEKSDSK